MHETFEHTADLGLRIRAADLDTLFAEAGLALFGTMVDDLPTVEPRQQVDMDLQGTDRDYLFFDWLNELLHHFDPGHMLFSKFAVQVTPTGLHGSAWGEPFDPDRHALGHELKAITYHGLKLEQTADGWLAEVIVDI